MIDPYVELKEDIEIKIRLQKAELIPFRNFKEKIMLTRKYERLAKMQIIDDKHILIEWRNNSGIY